MRRPILWYRLLLSRLNWRAMISGARWSYWAAPMALFGEQAVAELQIDADKSLVCVIDDDDAVRRSVCEVMRSRGYRAAAFRSAAAFMQSDEHRSCQCVVADIRMPGLSGLDLANALAAEGCAKPVIVITGLSSAHWPSLAAERGAAGFLRKPFLPEALLALVEHAFETQRRARS